MLVPNWLALLVLIITVIILNWKDTWKHFTLRKQDKLKLPDPNTNGIEVFTQPDVNTAMVPANLAYEAFNKFGFYANQPVKPFQFVATLLPSYVLMIAPNDSNLTDFSQLADKNAPTITIDVGQRYSGSHSCLLQLLKALRIETKHRVVFSNPDQTATNYQQGVCNAVFRLSDNPQQDQTILTASNLVNSHFVDFRSFNNGNQFVSAAEQDFYLTWPYFQKGFLEFARLIPKAYPKMAILDHLQMDLLTLKISNIIIARPEASSKEIAEFLSVLIDKMKANLSAVEMCYTQLPLQTHQGTLDFLKERSIYGTNPDCIYYLPGYCK